MEMKDLGPSLEQHAEDLRHIKAMLFNVSQSLSVEEGDLAAELLAAHSRLVFALAHILKSRELWAKYQQEGANSQ